MTSGSSVRTTSEPGRPTVDYQALMTCHASDGWLPRAQGQLADWLRNKKHWDIDTGHAGEYASGSRVLRIAQHTAGNTRSLTAQLVEADTPKGTWTTDLLAHDQAGAGDWIELTVRNDRGHFVDVPVLARYLMQTLPLGDGALEYVDAPQVLGATRVDELIELLRDEQRHGQVFVAGSSGDGEIPFDTWVEAVGRWTKQVYGLAQVIVLDPHATAVFAGAVGQSHQAPPWTIRTYFPAVDPASTVDARRHRILGTERLAGNDRAVQVLLGSIARSHAAERLEARDVARVRRVFERLENRAIVEAVALPAAHEVADRVEVPPPSEVPTSDEPPAVAPTSTPALAEVAAQAARYLAEIELTKAILRIDTLEEETLRAVAASAVRPHTDPEALTRAVQRMEAQQERIEQLEDKAKEYARGLEDEQVDHAITGESLGKREDEARWLRSQLRERSAFDVAHTPVPVESTTAWPESFEELVARLDELNTSGVVFSGDMKVMRDLDDVDHLQRAVRTAYDCFLVLSDYVRARRDGCCEGGIEAYIRNTPDGFRTVPLKKFGRGESRRTMDAHGDERMLPVPAEVDPSGRAEMTAHFKLANIGMVSPRMYFLDRFHEDDRVYVGYVGPHLTNTQTN